MVDALASVIVGEAKCTLFKMELRDTQYEH